MSSCSLKTRRLHSGTILSLSLIALIGTFLFTGCPQDPEGTGGNQDGNTQENPAASIEKGEEGIEFLKDGNYDDAISSFEDAYKLDKNNPTAIVYSTLGRIASIAVDSKVQTLVKNRLGINGYPGTVDKLISVDWLEEYVEERRGRSQAEGGGPVNWYSYYEPISLPGMDVPSWFSNTALYKDSLTTTNLKSVTTFTWLIFTNLIDKNTDGLNALLDDLLSTVFGADFEAAYNRIANLNEDIKLDENTLEAFGLLDLFEGEVYIGKAELNMLFAALRIFKASLEWVAAYDWNTDLNFLKNGPLWDDWEKLETQKPASLPLRNNFLKDRNNGMMAKSKADFIKAIDDSIAAYNSWIGAASNLPTGYKDTLQEYKWLKEGFEQFKAAINSGGNFYVKILDSGDTYTNTETDALFGINMGKFFNPGQLAINELIENAPITGKGAAPKFYGYNESSKQWVEITQKTQLSSYTEIGFNIKTQPVKQIIIYGFDEMPNNEKLSIFDSEFAGYVWDWYN